LVSILLILAFIFIISLFLLFWVFLLFIFLEGWDVALSHLFEIFLSF
jgi:hypothetical protein